VILVYDGEEINRLFQNTIKLTEFIGKEGLKFAFNIVKGVH